MVKQTSKYTVDYTVYKVSNCIEQIEDDEWHEYRVELIKDGKVIDQWDSRHETYNGTKSGRLTKEKAEKAAQIIQNDVKYENKANEWFNISE